MMVGEDDEDCDKLAGELFPTGSISSSSSGSLSSNEAEAAASPGLSEADLAMLSLAASLKSRTRWTGILHKVSSENGFFPSNMPESTSIEFSPLAADGELEDVEEATGGFGVLVGVNTDGLLADWVELWCDTWLDRFACCCCNGAQKATLIARPETIAMAHISRRII